VAADLYLAQEPSFPVKTVKAVSFSDGDMAGLGLTGGSSGQEIILKNGVQIIYPTGSGWALVYAASGDVTLVPAANAAESVNSIYFDVFPWKLK
jgi:uncharacterized protein YjlB